MMPHCRPPRRLGPPLALLLAALLGAPTLTATVVEGLYEAEVPVGGKEPALRDEAVGRALAQVLTKVSGVRDVAGRPGVRAALAAPGRYLQQYHYETRMRDGPAPAQMLRVEFARDGIDGLIAEAGLPIWSRTRPTVLLWMVTDDGETRRFVSPAEDAVLWGRVEAVTGARGLPLIAPLLDLEDRAGLDVGDVWAQSSEAVRRISRRYEPEAILVGRARRAAGGGWEAAWTLLLADGEARYATAAGDLGAALAEGAHRTADELASRFAVTASGSDDVMVTVRGIDALEDYARALDYLESLDIVEGVQVTAVEGAAVSFRLAARGGAAALARAFALGGTLAAEPASAGGSPGAVAASTYRLLAR